MRHRQVLPGRSLQVRGWVARLRRTVSAVSSSNCGACGTTCSGTQVCSNGSCANSCGAGQDAVLGRRLRQPPHRLGQLRHLRQRLPGRSTCMNGSCGCATAGSCVATTPASIPTPTSPLRWLQQTVHRHLRERRLHGDDGYWRPGRQRRWWHGRRYGRPRRVGRQRSGGCGRQRSGWWWR